MRTRAKIDQNQPAIIDALERNGWMVLSLAPMGRGVPDLLIGGWSARSRKWVFKLIEVKTTTGTLTPDQIAFQAKGWPVTVIRTVDEALAL